MFSFLLVSIFLVLKYTDFSSDIVIGSMNSANMHSFHQKGATLLAKSINKRGHVNSS